MILTSECFPVARSSDVTSEKDFEKIVSILKCGASFLFGRFSSNGRLDWFPGICVPYFETWRAPNSNLVFQIRTRKDNIAGVNLPVFETYQDGSDSYELAGLARGGQQMQVSQSEEEIFILLQGW